MRICLVPLIPQHVAHVLAQPLVRPLDLCLMLMGDVALLVLLMARGRGGELRKGAMTSESLALRIEPITNPFPRSLTIIKIGRGSGLGAEARTAERCR